MPTATKRGGSGIEPTPLPPSDWRGVAARNRGVSQLSDQSLYLNKFRKKYRVEIVAE